jgi:hypothetical protein
VRKYNELIDIYNEKVSDMNRLLGEHGLADETEKLKKMSVWQYKGRSGGGMTMISQPSRTGTFVQPSRTGTVVSQGTRIIHEKPTVLFTSGGLGSGVGMGVPR